MRTILKPIKVDLIVNTVVVINNNNPYLLHIQMIA